MPDEDVLDVVTELIENRFRMSLADLRRATTAAPEANPQATEAVHWHGLLTQSQEALQRAEDTLVAALMTEVPGELQDPVMDLAHRVNAAVTARDGRVMVIRYILDDNTTERVWRGTSPAAARGPALQTSPPVRPASVPAPVRGAAR